MPGKCHAATRARTAWTLALAIVLASTDASWGQGCLPQPNEDCPSAMVFTTADLPYSITAPLGCFNDEVDKPYFDIFYRYDCTQTGLHHIDMCDSDGDTYIRIWGNGCGWSAGIELAVADDNCPGSPPNADPLLSFTFEADQTYWIELGTWRDVPPWAPPPNSPYNFRVTLDGADTPTSCDGVGAPMTLVSEPGNPDDTTALGSVPNLFRIGLFEVTNREYVQFLNAVADDDANGLFDQNMTDSGRGGIIQGGIPGAYAYWAKENFSDKPVNFVTWLSAARYCNWLHNGMPTGAQDPTTTERGAYDLSLPHDQIFRSADARFFIPTHDEWYKAAYYDPFDPGADGGGSPDYWKYPTRSDALPVQATADAAGDVTNPGVNVANHGGGADWNGENGNVTTVGGTTSVSAFSAFDLGGNLYEMTETLGNPIADASSDARLIPTRESRGGDFANNGILMSSPTSFAIDVDMTAGAGNVGFRVAATICLGDFDGDNDVDNDDATAFDACFTGTGGGPVDPNCIAGDFDTDGDIDCADWTLFLQSFAGDLEPPPPALCSSIPTVSDWGIVAMAILLLTAATLAYSRRSSAAGHHSAVRLT